LILIDDLHPHVALAMSGSVIVTTWWRGRQSRMNPVSRLSRNALLSGQARGHAGISEAAVLDHPAK
jgi:hypothetical protein